MQNINIIINGAQGRMGSMAATAIKQTNELKVVAELGRGDDLVSTIKITHADIVVDLTSAESVYKNASAIIDAGARPVIGTSGLLPQEIEVLQKSCTNKKLGGIIAPNFSIGAVLMMKFANLAAKYYEHAEIIEMHHEQKKDAPSGTAMKTADGIAKIRANKVVNCKETLSGALGAKQHDVPIHSVRLPGLLAHQMVVFGAPGETLTIRHDTTDRQSFMDGIILSCKKVMQLDQLIYGLETLL